MNGNSEIFSSSGERNPFKEIGCESKTVFFSIIGTIRSRLVIRNHSSFIIVISSLEKNKILLYHEILMVTISIMIIYVEIII